LVDVRGGPALVGADEEFDALGASAADLGVEAGHELVEGDGLQVDEEDGYGIEIDHERGGGKGAALAGPAGKVDGGAADLGELGRVHEEDDELEDDIDHRCEIEAGDASLALRAEVHLTPTPWAGAAGWRGAPGAGPPAPPMPLGPGDCRRALSS